MNKPRNVLVERKQTRSQSNRANPLEIAKATRKSKRNNCVTSAPHDGEDKKRNNSRFAHLIKLPETENKHDVFITSSVTSKTPSSFVEPETDKENKNNASKTVKTRRRKVGGVLKPSHENVLEEAIQPTDNVKPRGILKNSQNKEIVNATEEQIKSVSALKEHHNCRSINIKTFFANNKKVKRGQTVTVASPLKQLEMKNLRQRKTQNYAESSIESPNTSQCSTSCSETKKHVPVYLQQPLNDQSPKKTSDLYEFVPDTKKPKKKMSDADFIVRPSKRQRKPKWQTKVKKVLTNLGLDVNSENLEKDLSDLIKKVSEAEKKEPQDIAKSDTNTDAVKNCENTTYSLSQTVLQNSFPTTPVKDEHIGFLVTSPESTTSTRNSPKVTILSHQVLTPDRILNIRDNNSRRTLESPIVFPNQPNANSTMLHNPNINSTMTEHQNPWRPPSPIKRNRYFLSIKKNDLPSVDQDMIIDSKLVENLSVSKNATNTESEPIKKMFQPTITSFVNPNEEGKSIVNESNLFDADHYERIHLSCKTIPKKSGGKRQKSDGISNYFGFDSDDEASEIIEKQVKVAKKKGPCRVPVVMLVNIIKRVQDDDIFFIDPLQRFNKTGGSIAEKLVPDSDDEDSGVKADVDDLEDVPLFMDLKPEPQKKYEAKSKRRVRLASVSSEGSEFIKPDVKTRKRNNKKEEWNEEAEKWAAGFNSLCQEIDAYELNME